jgi:hypothetical protein
MPLPERHEPGPPRSLVRVRKLLSRGVIRLAATYPALLSSPAREFLTYDCVDRASIRTSLKQGHHLSHGSPDVGSSCLYGCAHGSAQFLGVYLSRQIHLERRDLSLLFLAEIGASGFAIHPDGLTPLLDTFSDDVGDVIVGGVSPEFNLAILDLGNDHPEEHHAVF